MKRCLIDAGPLIALFDKDDKFHVPIKEFIKKYQGRLYTSWPVITETLHMLNFSVDTQMNLLKWIKRGALEIKEISTEDISRIIYLSEKYSDVPMDFADATLIILSETEDIKEIISVDSDFYIYRDIRNEYIKNIFNYH
ncbi:type II toxin-antitoxin system VapC family toxin [Natronospora cellulosivora (SeqCode)]